MGNLITFQTAWRRAPDLLRCCHLHAVFSAACCNRVREKTGGSSKHEWEERLNQFCEASCLNYRYPMSTGCIYDLWGISLSCFRALSIMRSPAAGAKLPVNVLNSCGLLAQQSTFSFHRTQGTTGGCYPHACRFFFPHPIQLSPIALLFLLHLLSACLRGDHSLVREACPPECRMW